MKMAASSRELDSFIIKFRQLWKEGLNASLNVTSEAGKVSMSLSLVLEKERGNQTDMSIGNSRDRRRKRRYEQRNHNINNLDAENKSLSEIKDTKAIGEIVVQEEVVAAKANADMDTVKVEVVDEYNVIRGSDAEKESILSADKVEFRNVNVINAQSVIHNMGTDERKVDPIKNADLSLTSGFFPSKISDVSSKDAHRGTVGFFCLTCDCCYSQENDYKIHMRNKHRKELKTRYE